MLYSEYYHLGSIITWKRPGLPMMPQLLGGLVVQQTKFELHIVLPVQVIP
jgi:hypothetical protein